MTPDITQISKRNFGTLAAIQKQALDTLAKANQEWINCAKQEAKLTSTLAHKVTTAKSIPETTAACQEWVSQSQQIDLISGQAKKAFDDDYWQLHLTTATAAGHSLLWKKILRLLPIIGAACCYAATAEAQTAPTVLTKNIVTDFGATCNGYANDNAAFTAFNNWGLAQTLPIVLTIPSGSVRMFSNPSPYYSSGLRNFAATVARSGRFT
jgi:hypothetical protein